MVVSDSAVNCLDTRLDVPATREQGLARQEGQPRETHFLKSLVDVGCGATIQHGLIAENPCIGCVRAEPQILRYGLNPEKSPLTHAPQHHLHHPHHNADDGMRLG